MRYSLGKLILRRYPFYSGHYKVLTSAPVRWLTATRAGTSNVWTRSRSGLHLQVSLQDLEGRSIDLLGDWDPRISWACRRILRRGDTFVDIGANYGLESLVAAACVGGSGQVHAFEPQPNVAEMLRQSAARNGLANLRVHGVALSDKSGTMTLHIPAGHSGAASLNPHAGDAAGETITVEVQPLTDYFRQLQVGPVRLVKIDVEGHEAAVFAGASEFFEHSPPAAVLFESNDWFEGISRGLGAADYPFADLPTVTFLRQHRYRFYAFGRSYLRVNLYHVPGDQPRHPPVSDILAIHESAAADLLPRLGLKQPA